uniref:uncharacterized protein n=1 Tax=Myxine glutinosa TaxID=7769 RepID=UPI00358DF443
MKVKQWAKLLWVIVNLISFCVAAPTVKRGQFTELPKFMLEEPVELAIENLTSAIVNDITLPNDKNALHLEKATHTQGEPLTEATLNESTFKHFLDNMEMGMQQFQLSLNAGEKDLEKHAPEKLETSHSEQDLEFHKVSDSKENNTTHPSACKLSWLAVEVIIALSAIIGFLMLLFIYLFKKFRSLDKASKDQKHNARKPSNLIKYQKLETSENPQPKNELVPLKPQARSNLQADDQAPTNKLLSVSQPRTNTVPTPTSPTSCIHVSHVHWLSDRHSSMSPQVSLLDCPSARLAHLNAEQQRDVEFARCGALALSSCSKSSNNKRAILEAGGIKLMANLLRSSHKALVSPVVSTLEECASECAEDTETMDLVRTCKG